MDDRYELVNLEVKRDEGITAKFADGHIARFGLTELRLACPCAACRDLRSRGQSAWPGPNSPMPLRIVDARFHGAWAFNITWNDQHSTGMYTFENIRRWSDGRTDHTADSDLSDE